jgi:hypothetical protein
LRPNSLSSSATRKSQPRIVPSLLTSNGSPWLPKTTPSSGAIPPLWRAEAFHWLDWYKVMARTSESLVRGGRLILVDRSLAEPLPWDRELRELIRESSTNRDYVPYDTAIELEVRGLITVEGRAQTETMAYGEPIEDYVESFHSRNGFSRARLQTRRAQEFDDKLKALLGQYCGGDILCLPVRACIVWGRPIAS